MRNRRSRHRGSRQGPRLSVYGSPISGLRAFDCSHRFRGSLHVIRCSHGLRYGLSVWMRISVQKDVHAGIPACTHASQEWALIARHDFPWTHACDVCVAIACLWLSHDVCMHKLWYMYVCMSVSMYVYVCVYVWCVWYVCRYEYMYVCMVFMFVHVHVSGRDVW